MNPVHATNAFYDALEKVDGCESMRVTVGPQVQSAGYPEAYADHEADARVLASALDRQLPARLRLPPRRRARPGRPQGSPTRATHRADVVRQELDEVFGDPPMGGFAPGGVSSGHMEGSAHYDGRAVDVFVRR